MRTLRFKNCLVAANSDRTKTFSVLPRVTADLNIYARMGQKSECKDWIGEKSKKCNLVSLFIKI